MLQHTLKKLDFVFKSYFTKKAKSDDTAHPPKFRGKRYFFTLSYLQNGFKIVRSISWSELFEIIVCALVTKKLFIKFPIAGNLHERGILLEKVGFATIHSPIAAEYGGGGLVVSWKN